MNRLDIQFQACDLGFCHGTSVLSKMIDVFTTGAHESLTIVNHVFGVTRPGNLVTAEITEAKWHVMKRSIYAGYHGGSTKIAVFRAKNITQEQRDRIVKKVLGKIGMDYPWWQFPLYLTDWLVFDEKVVTRKWMKRAEHAVCSPLWASPFSDEGLDFHVAPYAASPDDMWDFCVKNPDKYELILPLQKI